MIIKNKERYIIGELGNIKIGFGKSGYYNMYLQGAFKW